MTSIAASFHQHASGSEEDDRSTAQPTTLDELALLDGAALLDLYRRASVPDDLRAVAGEPVGRMLAVRGLERERPLFRVIRAFAGLSLFPWEGKTFSARDASRGGGINRVRLGPARMTWFPFETSVETSVVDGKPCIYLEYEQPGNPWFIARIRDEIREISPGLFLGPAMWKDRRGGATHVLWFAVDFRAHR